MRVVLDTNVIFSGLVFGGKPALVLRCFDGPDRTLLLTDHILLELRDVLRAKSGWDERFIAQAIAGLGRIAELIHPATRIGECRDPDDDRILEAALAGYADYIVTGDADLLSMGTFRTIPILTAATFLDRTAEI
jgi:putative PIN family toxin of toxin-antitoxin system